MVDGKFCITELLQKEEFKELFAGHVHPGLIVGEYSRGKKGLRFQKGAIQNEQVLRLLPKRYLRDFSISDLKDLPNNLGIACGVAVVSALMGNQDLRNDFNSWIDDSSNIVEKGGG